MAIGREIGWTVRTGKLTNVEVGSMHRGVVFGVEKECDVRRASITGMEW